MNLDFGIRREIHSTRIFETVGNHSVKFPLHRVFNAADRLTGLRPNPNLNDGYYVGDSTLYTCWQSSLPKRHSRRLVGAVHHMWGKALSTGGGDIAHYFTVEAVCDLPRFWARQLFLEQAHGEWQMAGIFPPTRPSPSSSSMARFCKAAVQNTPAAARSTPNIAQTLVYLNRATFAPAPVASAFGAATRPGIRSSAAR